MFNLYFTSYLLISTVIISWILILITFVYLLLPVLFFCYQLLLCNLKPVTFFFPDLRDDKQFFVDHPGAVPITTAQVRFLGKKMLYIYIYMQNFSQTTITLTACVTYQTSLLSLKGEELKKLIAAPFYVECSSKTQQVCFFLPVCFLLSYYFIDHFIDCHFFGNTLLHTEC